MELRSKVILGLVGTGVLLCGVGLYVIGRRYVDFPLGDGELSSATKAYRAAGLPWTARELTPPRKGKNAEPLLSKARNALDFPAWKAISKAMQTSPTREKLAPFAKAADLAVLASNADYWQSKWDWDYGSNLEFPEYEKTRGLIQILSARAAVEAQAGEGRDAVRELQAGLKLAHMTGKEGPVIGILVEISERLAIYRGFEQAAAWTDAKGRRTLAAFRDEAVPAPDAKSALRHEAYVGLATMRNMDKFPQSDDDSTSVKIDPKLLLREGAPENPIQRSYMVRHLQLWTRVARSMEKDPGDLLALEKDLIRIGNDEDKETGVSHLLNKMSFPLFDHLMPSVVRCEADRRVARLYLQALIYHDQHGDFPASLKNLSGDRNDPFGGELRYRQDGGGFRIWSVGPNGENEAGATRKENKRADDVVAVYPPS
ncbi:hypothetical protein BH11ARM2_BH11ARM2_16960 [soil metagenome]